MARYGSSVVGGLRHDSDLDLFGVVARRLADAEKRSLVAVPTSWRHSRPEGWRPVELTLVVHDEQARGGYLGSVEDRWHDLAAARSTADDLVDRIRSAPRSTCGA